MIAPPPPANETERLADLHALELLDTPAEERFDRIVRLAMAIFDVGGFVSRERPLTACCTARP